MIWNYGIQIPDCPGTILTQWLDSQISQEGRTQRVWVSEIRIWSNLLSNSWMGRHGTTHLCQNGVPKRKPKPALPKTWNTVQWISKQARDFYLSNSVWICMDAEPRATNPCPDTKVSSNTRWGGKKNKKIITNVWQVIIDGWYIADIKTYNVNTTTCWRKNAQLAAI